MWVIFEKLTLNVTVTAFFIGAKETENYPVFINRGPWSIWPVENCSENIEDTLYVLPEKDPKRYSWSQTYDGSTYSILSLLGHNPIIN